MFSWSASTDATTLGQQAMENIATFRQRKQDHLNACLQHLIACLRNEVLYQSSLGSRTTTFELMNHEAEFPAFNLGVEERPLVYKLTPKDRQTLFDRLIEHCQQYPQVECHPRKYSTSKYCIRLEIPDPEVEAKKDN